MNHHFKNLAVGIVAMVPICAIAGGAVWLLFVHPPWLLLPMLAALMLVGCYELGQSIRSKRGGGNGPP